MELRKKIVEFLSSTSSNVNMNLTQYSIYDKVTDGLWEYCVENDLDPKDKEVREDYFFYEIEAWEDDQVNEFAQAFKL